MAFVRMLLTRTANKLRQQQWQTAAVLPRESDLQAGSIHTHKALAVELAAQLDLSDKGSVLLAVLAYARRQPLHCNILAAPPGCIHAPKAARTLQIYSTW